MGYARTKLTGVTVNMKFKAYNGYTLILPLGAKKAYLIDMEGHVVHQWQLPRPPALYGELLPNSNLLYAGHVAEGPLAEFEGAGGEILELDWDGNTVWSYKDPYLHHCFSRLYNGNTLVARWVPVPKAIASRVKGGLIGTEREGLMWGDCLQEINPNGKIVWEWLAHEHLDLEVDTICPLCARSQWTEISSIEALPQSDDILVSLRRTDSVAIIDKASGNIKWRWGAGEIKHPPDATMLDNGRILLYDSGYHYPAPAFAYSRLLEVDPNENKMVWEYKEAYWVDFYGAFMGNCQRLHAGNTLVSEAPTGRVFETTRKGDMVWEFVNPKRISHPVYGHHNIVPQAYRYGPEYEAFRGKKLEHGSLLGQIS